MVKIILTDSALDSSQFKVAQKQIGRPALSEGDWSLFNIPSQLILQDLCLTAMRLSAS